MYLKKPKFCYYYNGSWQTRLGPLESEIACFTLQKETHQIVTSKLII